MSDHALVVGCDAYPEVPGGDLRGAVADALAMRDWLLQSAGVSPVDLTLLASPSAQGKQLPPGVEAKPATRGALATAVAALVARSDVGAEDRLFVYFAGHGCRTDPLNETLSKDVLALHDFPAVDPAAGSAGVADLITRLEQSRFGNVLVVADACRNLPFNQPFQSAALGLDPKAPANRPYTPRVFLAQATTPGGVAGGGPGGVPPGAGGLDEQIRGYFTTALLDGLSGAGSAKVFDETAGRPYKVTWSSLRTYLEEHLAGQNPRLRGDGDPLLASFPDGWFPDVLVDVDVDPETEGAPDLTLEVSYADPTAFEDGSRRLTGPTPVQVSVPPRRLQFRARRQNLRGRVWKDVYRDMPVTIRLLDGPATSPIPSDLPPRRGATSIEGGLDVDVRGDPAAVVQVRDRSGAVLLSGVGTARGGLPPGDYTVTVTGVDARVVSEPVGVDKGRLTHLSMTAPVADASDWPAPSTLAGGLSGLSRAGRLAAQVSAQVRGETLLAVGAEPSMLDQLALAPEVGRELPRLGPRAAAAGRTWLIRRPSPWVTLTLGEHHLTVPLLPQTSTVLVLGPRDAELALYDNPSRVSPFLLADRVQALLANDRPDAAAIAFGWLAERFGDLANERPLLRMLGKAVAAAIEDAPHGQAPAGPLARSAPLAVRPWLLPGTMWAAVLDLPEAEPILREWARSGGSSAVVRHGEVTP